MSLPPELAGGAPPLGPDLTALVRRLDDTFLRWAGECGAEEWTFAPLLSAEAMAQLDYFASFPHLVTVPAALAPEEANLERFAASNGAIDLAARGGALALGALAPLRAVLAPAACYPIYAQRAGARLDRPLFVTVRGMCFRREAEFAALERQWSFSMREVVCLGDADAVHAFVERFQSRLSSALAPLGWPVEWRHATDSFFRSERSPKHLLQRIDPVKHELVTEEGLAIASTNLHRSAFAEAFDIRFADAPAHTACVAFGLERWAGWIARRVGEARAAWDGLALWRA